MDPATITATTNTYPSIQPSLNLDFANAKTLDPRITFTRSTTGTYYDGKTVAKAEENLATYSEDFTQVASWGATDTSVSGNTTTAPNGTSTADTLTASATTAANAGTVQIAVPLHNFGYGPLQRKLVVGNQSSVAEEAELASPVARARRRGG